MDNPQAALMAAATSFSTSTVRTDPGVILSRAAKFLQWLEEQEPDEEAPERVTVLDAMAEKSDEAPPNRELHAHDRGEPQYGDELKISRRIGFGN